MPASDMRSYSWLRVVSATVRESVLIVQRTPERTRAGSGCSASVCTALHFQFAVGHMSRLTWRAGDGRGLARSCRHAAQHCWAHPRQRGAAAQVQSGCPPHLEAVDVFGSGVLAQLTSDAL